ncbi:MAG: hypothetical protein K0M45_02140 [Candidatus Paracaedibacteraceae bacterium]|nr:hypothetical protein [Candidatus Paracaedibacteraceae bacterium]
MTNKLLYTTIITILSISTLIASDWKTQNLTSKEQEIVNKQLEKNSNQQFAGIKPDPVSNPEDNAYQAIFVPKNSDMSISETQKYHDNLTKSSTEESK